jgi:hypothetical protein
MTGRLSNVELKISPLDLTTVLNVLTTCSRAILGSHKDLALLLAPIDASDVHLADYIAEAEYENRGVGEFYFITTFFFAIYKFVYLVVIILFC